ADGVHHGRVHRRVVVAREVSLRLHSVLRSLRSSMTDSLVHKEAAAPARTTRVGDGEEKKMHVIRMQHPAKNALGSDLMGWLDEEISRAGAAPILLTGTADAFSAGLALREVASLDAIGMEKFLRRLDVLAA